VKIKNRLEDKSNDILINLFFKERILCEIQLGIFKEVNDKEKLYSEFNHFLYELIRSEFGVLSALGNVVAQYDPIVSFFTFDRHKPPASIKVYNARASHSEKEPKLASNHSRKTSKDLVLSETAVEKGIEKPFICVHCKNLRIVHNIKFYYRPLSMENYCNECIETMMLEHPELCSDIIEELFKYYVKDEKIEEFM
jgi:hypothetical protein